MEVHTVIEGISRLSLSVGKMRMGRSTQLLTLQMEDRNR